MPRSTMRKSDHLLAEQIDCYLTWRLRAGQVNGLTARNYRCFLRQFAEIVGSERPVASLTRADVARWLEVSMSRLAPATRRLRWSIVRGFMRWLVENDLIARDPTSCFPAPRVPHGVPRSLPTDAVAAALDAVPDERGWLIIVLMVQLGCRACEVANLELGDVDMGNRRVRLVGKGRNERVVALTTEAQEAFVKYLAVRSYRAGPLIQSQRRPGKGLKPATLVQYVGKWLYAAGVKQRAYDGVSAHAFRHTFATDMLNSGANLRLVQAALGHQHLTSTEVCCRIDTRDMEKAMEGRRYGRREALARPLTLVRTAG